MLYLGLDEPLSQPFLDLCSNKMSQVMKKPALGLCNQVRLK